MSDLPSVLPHGEAARLKALADWRPRRRTHTIPAVPIEPVRVSLILDRRALEDLDLLVRARFDVPSRSALVREAILWLRSREAAALIRLHRTEEARRLKAEQEARALVLSRADRDHIAAEDVLHHGLLIAAERPTR